MSKINSIIKLLRPKHYIKNLVIFLPVLFSLNFNNIDFLLNELVVFISFCLMASAVYVFNDIFDLENDKKHPTKSKRPIASGELSKGFAIFLYIILIALSSIIALMINFISFIIVISYLILNILYTIKLKDIPLIDVVCIALGFILRLLIGCAAIFVVPSPLVIIMTFFVSMFFTFSKRKLEIKLVKNQDDIRESIRGFDLDLINQFVQINAVLSIAFYFTYVIDAETILKAGTEYLYLTVIPFTLIIFRLLFLIHKASTDSPMTFFGKDKILSLFILLYLVTFGLIYIL